MTALLLSPPASAQKSGEIRRGSLRGIVRAQGSVAAEEVSHLDATIEGRIETVTAFPNTWAQAVDELATLATLELAAMIDAKGTTSKDTVESRWRRVYKPTAVRCPSQCYILKVFAKPKKLVQPGAALIEFARKVRLFGRVRTGDAHRVRNGHLIEFWDVRRPHLKIQGRVEGLRGASFTVLLTPKHFLPPGTEWEGEIIVVDKKEALRVPTAALIRHGNEIYLPVRVLTGITTHEETEITSGVTARTKFLILDTSKVESLKTYEPEPVAPRPPKEPSQRRGERSEDGSEPEYIEPGAEYPSDLDQ
ncbi:MAG: hypothetical protein HY922_08680 [Elusimicrobia bacterium]|nr:hypothetical protein [Elusimicrobiota bacterium]